QLRVGPLELAEVGNHFGGLVLLETILYLGDPLGKLLVRRAEDIGHTFLVDRLEGIIGGHDLFLDSFPPGFQVFECAVKLGAAPLYNLHRLFGAGKRKGVLHFPFGVCLDPAQVLHDDRQLFHDDQVVDVDSRFHIALLYCLIRLMPGKLAFGSGGSPASRYLARLSRLTRILRPALTLRTVPSASSLRMWLLARPETSAASCTVPMWGKRTLLSIVCSFLLTKRGSSIIGCLTSPFIPPFHIAKAPFSCYNMDVYGGSLP